MSTAVFHNIHSSQSQKPSAPSGWGCIEALSNPYDQPKPEIYVHPLVKRSASMLSDKSLEMCTENLGSETGTDITEEEILSIFSSDSDAEESMVSKERKRKSIQRMEARKSGYESLPPPLTILRGVNSIRVQPLREEGRLVMNVVSTLPRKSSVVARRSDGRLTMTLAEDVEARDHGETRDETECGECEEVRERFDAGDEEEERVEEDEEEEEEEEEEEDDEANSLVMEEDKDGMIVEVGGKFGIGEIQSLRRCKESERGSRKRLINLEPFWVV